MDKLRLDPAYVQISKPEASALLGLSLKEFDRRRHEDDRCPAGFLDSENWTEPVRFRLSDVYRYSEQLMQDAKEAPTGLPHTTHR